MKKSIKLVQDIVVNVETSNVSRSIKFVQHRGKVGYLVENNYGEFSLNLSEFITMQVRCHLAKTEYELL